MNEPSYKMWEHLTKKELLTKIIDEFEQRYDTADDETDTWRKREAEARQAGYLKKAHYHQRKKLYSEGYADGLFMARYILKLWRDEV